MPELNFQDRNAQRRGKSYADEPANDACAISFCLDFFRPPDQHFQVSGKMQQGLGIRQFNAGGLRHGIDVKLRFGILQLPRQVMDVRAKNTALIDGIEAVALGEKRFD